MSQRKLSPRIKTYLNLQIKSRPCSRKNYIAMINNNSWVKLPDQERIPRAEGKSHTHAQHRLFPSRGSLQEWVREEVSFHPDQGMMSPLNTILKKYGGWGGNVFDLHPIGHASSTYWLQMQDH